jgi:hypothetical protein
MCDEDGDTGFVVGGFWVYYVAGFKDILVGFMHFVHGHFDDLCADHFCFLLTHAPNSDTFDTVLFYFADCEFHSVVSSVTEGGLAELRGITFWKEEAF